MLGAGPADIHHRLYGPNAVVGCREIWTNSVVDHAFYKVPCSPTCHEVVRRGRCASPGGAVIVAGALQTSVRDVRWLTCADDLVRVGRMSSNICSLSLDRMYNAWQNGHQIVDCARESSR